MEIDKEKLMFCRLAGKIQFRVKISVSDDRIYRVENGNVQFREIYGNEWFISQYNVNEMFDFAEGKKTLLFYELSEIDYGYACGYD